MAVIKTGGKQYLVKEGMEIYVDKLPFEKGADITLETLALIADTETGEIELGTPTLKEKTQAQVVDQVRGDKIRVAKFKAKVRYRKVKGFRADLSKIKIIKI